MSPRIGLRDDLDPTDDLLVADLAEQLGVIGSHVLADVREDIFVGVGAGDVAAFALHLAGHRRTPFDALEAFLGADYRGFSMAATTIQLCGRFAVELEGERVETRLPGRQGRMLFAYLVLNRDRTVTRSELIEAIWPGNLPHEPADALAALLSKVRGSLPGDSIEGRGELQLLLAGERPHRRRAGGSGSTRGRVGLLAPGLAAGVERCALRAAGRETATARRVRGTVDRRMAARRSTMSSCARSSATPTSCLGLGGTELAGAERASRLLVRSAPLRETASALLMQALEAQGNAAEALVVYESLRRRLRDELGVAPGEPLQASYRRLLGPTAAD